jgi:hypothetical protein
MINLDKISENLWKKIQKTPPLLYEPFGHREASEKAIDMHEVHQGSGLKWEVMMTHLRILEDLNLIRWSVSPNFIWIV